MGFKDWADTSAVKTEAKKWGFRLLPNRDRIYNDRAEFGTLAGAQADVIDQALTSRTTATRVALGTVIAPGVGTLVGAMAKKKERAVVIRITCVDSVLVSQTATNDLAAAYRFCAQFNRWVLARS